MNLNVPGIIYLTFLCLLISQNTFSSDGGASMSDKDINNVSKTDVVEKDDKERLSKAASLLTNYEIEAKKLLEMLKTKNINSKTIQNKAKDLLSLSEVVIESAQFRLPQCNEYLTKTLAIKTSLEEISHETLEKDYHHEKIIYQQILSKKDCFE